jgi:hypothetical protein
MPHYKCTPCKTRLHRPGGPAELVGDLCPDCGALLEPVGDLSEVVGFRAITSRDDASDGGAPPANPPIAERIDEFLSRREAVLAEARRDAAQWLDDGASYAVEAVTMPWPDATS